MDRYPSSDLSTSLPPPRSKRTSQLRRRLYLDRSTARSTKLAGGVGRDGSEKKRKGKGRRGWMETVEGKGPEENGGWCAY
jgi:hypothetical protein